MNITYPTLRAAENAIPQAIKYFTPYIESAIATLPAPLGTLAIFDDMVKFATDTSYPLGSQGEHRVIAIIKVSLTRSQSVTKIRMRQDGTVNTVLIEEAVHAYALKRKTEVEQIEARRISTERRDALSEMYHTVVRPTDDADQLQVTWRSSEGVVFKRDVHHTVATAVVDELVRSTEIVGKLIRGSEQ